MAERGGLTVAETGWVVVGQALSATGALAVGLGLANGLEPAAYGTFSIGLTAATLAQQSVFGGTAGAALRLRPMALERAEDPAFHRALGRLLVVESLLYAICALVAAAALSRFAGWSMLIAWAAVFSLASAAAQMLASLQAARRRRVIVALHAGAGQWLRLPAVLALLAWYGASPAAAMAGFAFAAGLVLCSQALAHRDWPPMTRGVADEAWLQRLVGYAWPFSLFGAFTWLQSSIDRWALAVFASLHETGLYAAVLQLGYLPLLALSAAVEQAVAPVLFGLAGDGTDAGRVAAACRAAQRLALGALATTAVLAALAALAAPVLFARLLPPDYATVSDLLWCAVLAGGLFAVGQILSLARLSRLDPRGLIAPKIAIAIVASCGIVVGAAAAGARGVIVAQVVASAAYAAWMWTANRAGRVGARGAA